MNKSRVPQEEAGGIREENVLALRPLLRGPTVGLLWGSWVGNGSWRSPEGSDFQSKVGEKDVPSVWVSLGQIQAEEQILIYISWTIYGGWAYHSWVSDGTVG